MGEDYGWGTGKVELRNDWGVLRQNIQNYIKGINFGYKNKLKEIGVDYIDAKAYFNDQQSVQFEYSNQRHQLRAKSFVIATGVRPRMYDGLPELTNWAITSDDLFSLPENPGKTLVIGGGYIAVECAGFLRGLGNEVVLANRSSFLRVFDKDMAKKVVDQLEEDGIHMMANSKIKAVEKLGDRQFKVHLEMTLGGKLYNEVVEVNTILVAIGRDSNPAGYGAEKAGLSIDEFNKKIIGRDVERERTNVDHIYAVGDVVLGVPELMPVAQKSGRLLAKRIYERIKRGDQVTESDLLKQWSTDYSLIPTTVFSPTEYSFIGLSEEEAATKFGSDKIEVYHRETTPLQYSIYKNNTKLAYMKVIVSLVDDKVIGMHYFGPSADEVIGGFAVAMKLGMTKKDLDGTIGIHPSTSEDLFNLDVTKRSGEEFRKTECFKFQFLFC